MTTATLTRAEFLKVQERTEVASDATLQARWGDQAADTSQSSVLLADADAATEATRQLAYLGHVRASDTVVLEGVYFDLEGETVRIAYAATEGSFFNAGATADMLVMQTAIDLGAGTTTVTGEVLL